MVKHMSKELQEKADRIIRELLDSLAPVAEEIAQRKIAGEDDGKDTTR